MNIIEIFVNVCYNEFFNIFKVTDSIQLYTTTDINSAPSKLFTYPLDAYGAEIQMEAMRNLNMNFDPHYSVFLAGPNLEPQKLKSKYTLRSLGAGNGMVLYILLTEPKPNSSIPSNTRPLNSQNYLPRLNTSHSSNNNSLNKASAVTPNLRGQTSSELASKPKPLIMQNKSLKQNPLLLSRIQSEAHSTSSNQVQKGLPNFKNQYQMPQNANNNNTNIENDNQNNTTEVTSQKEGPNYASIGKQILSDITFYLFSESDFKIIKTNRSFSIVTEKSTGIKYAIKKLQGQIQYDKFSKEFLAIQNAEAGCILHAEGFIQNPPSILYEYSPYGSLDDILDSELIMEEPKEWNDTAKMITLFGIAEGMRELHSHRIMHRNLKPSNVIFDDRLFPKIGDVGFTREYDRNPCYMAPEMLNGGPYKSKVDVFAYGMIAFQLITQSPPFDTSISFQNIKKLIIDGKRPKIPDTVPPCYASLIEKCWDQDPSNRPTFSHIVELFVKGNLDYPDADIDAFHSFQYEFAPQFAPELAKVTPIQRKAKQGDPESQLLFSNYLIRGIGVVKNVKEAIKYLRMCAENSSNKGLANSEAQFILSRILFRLGNENEEATKYLLKSAQNGNNKSKNLLKYLSSSTSIEEPQNDYITNQKHTNNISNDDEDSESLFEQASSIKKSDPKASFQLFKKAADLGNCKAQLQVALAYHNGHMGTSKNIKTANHYYKLAADQGNPKAQCNLAFNLQHGDGIEKDVAAANQLFLKSANNGYSLAQYNYGCNLSNGTGLSQNHKEANRYYKLAADNGHVQAIVTYASNLAKGIGTPQNYKEANQYYKKAMKIDPKNTTAIYSYATNLSNGNGFDKKDLEEANKLFQIAADLGHTRSMCSLAYNYQKGIGIQQDLSQACKYYKMAADQKYPVAMYNYASNLESGSGIEKNVEEANKYFKMAADLGNSNAQYSYAMNLIKGNGCEANIELANKYLKKSCDQKNQRAQYQYAIHLQKGNGVEQDRKLANELLKLSADQGNVNAQFYYGYNLFNGNGIEKNPEEANKYYKLAADKGNSNSQCNLACSYLNGIGVEKDIVMANKYYKMSADSGNAVAQYNYGLHLMNGKGIDKDPKAGVVYLKKSADSGNSSAQYCMSFCYEHGTGIAANKELSAKYLKMSADNGNKLALQKIKQTSKNQ